MENPWDWDYAAPFDSNLGMTDEDMTLSDDEDIKEF